MQKIKKKKKRKRGRPLLREDANLGVDFKHIEHVYRIGPIFEVITRSKNRLFFLGVIDMIEWDKNHV